MFRAIVKTMSEALKIWFLHQVLMLFAYLLALLTRQKILSSYLSGESQFHGYENFLILASLLFTIFGYAEGMFAPDFPRLSRTRRLSSLLIVSFLVFLSLSLMAFFLQYHLFSRTFLVVFLIFNFLLLALLDFVMHRNAPSVRRLLVLGHPDFYRLCRKWSSTKNGIVFLDRELVLSDYANLPQIVEKFEPFEIWLCQVDEATHHKILDLLQTHDLNVPLRNVDFLFRALNQDIFFKKYENYLFHYLLEPGPVSRDARRKRAFDLGILTLTLPLWAGLMVSVALLALIFQGRPIFFIQRRAGEMGRVFELYKFRTMHTTQEISKPDSSQDTRLTFLGWFLRRSSLDEIPQILNILKGDESA